MTEYHRDPETGKPVEEFDDDVDAGGYLTKELVEPKLDYDGNKARENTGRRAPLPQRTPSPMGI
jgi:hypothetical protein